MEKTIEIPFGAKDSELKGWEYTIPENMEAEIKDGKIIVKQKESEDERIRKWLIDYFAGVNEEIVAKDRAKIIAYLERQKEQPMPDSTQLIELWNEDKEMLKEKDFRDDAWRLAYNAFLCGFGRGIAVNKQEQPEVDLEKERETIWHNAVKEVPTNYGAEVLVACRNKNKEDGIWLYDLIQCWEGKWEPRVNWETPVKWVYVRDLDNARKEE